MKTVVSVFDDLEDARDAIDDLVDLGISRDNISLVARDVSSEYEEYLDAEYEEDEEVAEAVAAGAVGGAVVGGLSGVLLGLGALAIPGIGPVIAAGPIAAGLSGAAIGGVTGAVLSPLIEWGVPEEEAEYYAESVRRGGTLVVVRAADERVEEAAEVLDDHDPVDIERRAQYWREEDDWTGYDAEADPYSADEIAQYRRQHQEWEDDYDADAFEEFADDFRRHYDAHYATSNYSYEEYTPAYRYGYELATDSRYHERDWDDVEAEARRDWDDHGDGPWEDFKDAVHHAWEQVKDVTGAGDYDFGAPDAEDEYQQYQADFRRHYESKYVTTDYTWSDYDNAYRYGYMLATHPRYHERDWDDLQAEARRNWDDRNDGPWEDFKDAVHHGWEQVKDVTGAGDYDFGAPDAEDESAHSRS